MKIISLHNYYKQPGGEDTAFSSELDLLRSHGYEVLEYIDNNARVDTMHPVSVALQTIWSMHSRKKLKNLLKQVRPQLAHFHNTFPLISPAAYYACSEMGIPVVQSLDNPRLLCPAATFYRDGAICEDCLNKTPPWPGVMNACYHNSRIQTAVIASMLTLHRYLKTWEKKVDIFVVATEFYRNKFIQGGLPAEKIALKPHFVSVDPGVRKSELGNYILFVGRLSPEKGIMTLLKACKNLKDIPVKIRGSGELADDVKKFIKENNLTKVELLGRLSRSELVDLAKGARFSVVPSGGYYETFGIVVIESFAVGVPVIVSNNGVLPGIVSDGQTGLHFTMGDSGDLAEKIACLWNNPKRSEEMGRLARLEYENKYTAERNYDILSGIYSLALQSKKLAI